MANIYMELGKKLSESEIHSIAVEYGVPYAALKAVILTETKSSGFYKDTLIPVVRFENHIFHKKTNGQYTKTHPTLSSVKFTNKYNKVGYNEYLRFLEAYKLNEDAAIWSTSWGLGQVMGFNHALVGYDGLKEFMSAMFESEYKQLQAMMEFIKATKLLVHMRTQNWAAFAKGYNGADYAQNNYHIKLAAFYKQYA